MDNSVKKKVPSSVLYELYIFYKNNVPVPI